MIRNVPFVAKQVQLFVGTLEALAPRLVVVLGAGVAHFLKNLLKLEAMEDASWVGMQRKVNGQSHGPIFLASSALSGKNGLDVFSRKRLIADMRRVVAVLDAPAAPDISLGALDCSR